MPSIDGLVASLLPDRLAGSVARRILRTMGVGVGAGTRASNSGEIAAMSGVLAGKDPVIFDVGANVGSWSASVLARFPGAQLHVFEPSEAHLILLHEALGDRPTAVNALELGAAPGSATLYKDAEITGLASLTKREPSFKGIEMHGAETVQFDTLDACAERNCVTRIDDLKIDVEGHELDVLKGAKGLTERGAFGAVQFEFGGCNVDTRAFLRDVYRLFSEQGFTLYRIRTNGRLAALGQYREFLEQFSTTNYLALSTETPA